LVWLIWGDTKPAVRLRDFKWDPRARQWVQGCSALCELRLVREFREIVREPLPEPADPRFKEWNVRERFPWGMQLVQQQLHERLVRNRAKDQI
jgi:hypothetical protein